MLQNLVQELSNQNTPISRVHRVMADIEVELKLIIGNSARYTGKANI
jgi:hypothetical protein